MDHLKNLPYELHTDRELEFMLTRGKPLAHFSDAYPADPDEDIFPELAFAPYVASGAFESRDYVSPLTEPAPLGHPHIRGIRHLFYARPHEAWRIDAYIMMLSASAKAGWSEGFERLEGALLGYEEWQTEIWLDRLRHSDHGKNFFWLSPLKTSASGSAASNYRLERP